MITAVTIVKRYLFRYQGQVGAYLIIGGVDASGPQLYSVSNHGYIYHAPYMTNGSGCLAAISHFERYYQPDMDLPTAKDYVAGAIESGVMNDLGSGSNVDLVVITKHGVEFLRNHKKVCVPDPLLRDYTFKTGTTKQISQKVKKISYDIVSQS